MKNLILLSTLTLAVLSLAFASPEDDKPTADEKAVHAAIEDYVLGFYEAKPERLERCLSKDLKKMGWWRPDEKSEYQGPGHMTYDQALGLAAKWNNEGQQGEDLKYEVTLFEVADKTACGKVTAKWGQDYFHLAKEEGQWKIHHVIWQSAPSKRVQ